MFYENKFEAQVFWKKAINSYRFSRYEKWNIVISLLQAISKCFFGRVYGQGTKVNEKT